MNNNFTYQKDAFGDTRCSSCAGIVDNTTYCKYCGNGEIPKKLVSKKDKRLNGLFFILFMFSLFIPIAPFLILKKIIK